MKRLIVAFLALAALFCLSFAACDAANTDGDKKSGEEPQTETTYTVTIKVNDAEYGTVSKAKAENVAKGTAITVSGNELTIGKEKIVATAADGEGETVYVFENFTGVTQTVTGDMTITANFKRTLKQYVITFSVEGREYASVSASKGEKISAPTVDPVKQSDSTHDYTFEGWFSGEIKWNFANDTIDGDTVLIAKFKVSATYTEEFLPSGL